MSRKTSSITYKLGISYFWNDRQYCIDNFSFFKILNTYKLLKGFLFLNNLDLIYYSLTKKAIGTFLFTTVVYPFKKKEIIIQNKIKTRIKWRFKVFYFKYYTNMLFSSTFFIKLKSINSSFYKKGALNYYSILLPIKKVNLGLYSALFLFIYWFKYWKIILLRLITRFDYIRSLFFHILVKKKKRKWISLRKKEIPLRVMEIYLKEFIRRFYDQSIEVNILNVFRILKEKKYSLSLNFSNLFKFKKFNYFWNFINIFYLGLLFNKIDLVLEVIARGLARKKKLHKRYLYSIISILDSLYWQKILPIDGIRLIVSGKIDSKTRKKRINFKRGILGFQTLKSKLLYSIIHYDTRFGAISLRFWITKV